MNKYLLIALFTTVAVFGGFVLKSNRDGLLREISQANAQVAQLEQQARQATQATQARDELDKQRFQEMSDAKNQIDTLRDQLAIGTKRVLVRATCPSAVPAASSSTSVDDGAEPALTAHARQDYLRLREQIVTTEAQLAALQDYIRQVVQGGEVMASLANKTIKHQIAMRGQFTRIAKQAALHLQSLKLSVKAELDEAMTARNWTAVARLRKTFVTIDKLIADEYELMSQTLRQELGDLFVYESEFTSKLLGFDFSNSLITEKLVESIVSSDPFDGKILGEWLDEQRLATQIKVKQTIRLGVLNGLSTSKIVDALYAEPGNPFLGAKRNAEVMIRTASAHVTSQASLKTFERVGFGSYQLSAVLDSRTTPVCRALDGKVYKTSDKARKVPPFHPGCRTVMIAVSEDEPAFTDGYEDWLGRQSTAEQEAILGPARFRLWRSGQPLESFVDLDTHHVIPLDQLRSKEVF